MVRLRAVVEIVVELVVDKVVLVFALERNLEIQDTVELPVTTQRLPYLRALSCQLITFLFEITGCSTFHLLSNTNRPDIRASGFSAIRKPCHATDATIARGTVVLVATEPFLRSRHGDVQNYADRSRLFLPCPRSI